jgi:branched-chain amino acid transport system substrate-binding protein
LLVTVAGGSAGPIQGGGTGDLATLPFSSCGAPVSGGDGPPDVLIASDFDLGAAFGSRLSSPMVQAIEYTLRLHHFRAGKYRVAYQSCDDSTVQTGLWNEGKCQANAHSMVATPSVVGVVGTLNSGCAAVELPIMTGANPPLAMISPANSYPGLTKHSVGSGPDEPGKYYPTGNRAYARDYPTDDIQATAAVTVMKSLGVRRPVVLIDDPHAGYQQLLATEFVAAARKAGMTVAQPVATPRAAADARSFVHASVPIGADAVFYASTGPSVGSVQAIRRSRAVLIALHALPGKLAVFAPDGFVIQPGLRSWAGAGASGTYITGAYVTDPNHQLPAAGREFVRDFSATQPGRVANTFTPYAAQATEVLLAAIAASDGTRGGVARQLLKVRVHDGILGSFGFDRNGDITPTLMPVFRVPPPGAPPGPDPVYRLLQIRSDVPPA